MTLSLLKTKRRGAVKGSMADVLGLRRPHPALGTPAIFIPPADLAPTRARPKQELSSIIACATILRFRYRTVCGDGIVSGGHCPIVNDAH